MFLFKPFQLRPLALFIALGFGAAQGVLANPFSVSGTEDGCSPTQEQATHFVTPAQTSGGDQLPLDYTRVTADELDGQSQIKTHAKGSVIVERNDQVLNADWIDYDQTSTNVKAGQRFTLSQPTANIEGDDLDYNLDSAEGQAKNARFESDAEDSNARLQGVGDTLDFKGDKQYQLNDAKVNTCRPGDHSWFLQAESIDANYNTNIGVARNAKLIFKGVPLLYTPWIDFPLDGSRKSGLLAPSVKFGSDGFELITPYYFNLAPNYDLTVSPHFIQDRGLMVGGEFRYLQPDYKGNIQAEYLNNDRKADESNRYSLSMQHDQRLASNWLFGLDYNQVSDDDYFRDFGNRLSIAENTNLNRQAWLNHYFQAWGGSGSAQLMVQDHQTLQNDTRRVDEPYAILPRLSFNWQRSLGDANVSLFAEATRFDSDTKQTGKRLVVMPTVKWDFNNSWGFVRPKMSLHATQYQLDDFRQQKSRNVSRTLPIFSVDSGLYFDRETTLFDGAYTQTLEPRLFYTYIPTKSQNDLPNFDASENEFNFSQLFRENRYSGQDRINAANHVSTALTTRLIADETGIEHLRAGIGQRFYIKNDDVNLAGAVNKRNDSKSDFMAFAGGDITRDIRFDTDYHYDQSLRSTKSYNVSLSYNPEPGKVVSLRYRYGRNEEIYPGYWGEMKQVDLAGQWPINRNYAVVARQNYSLSDNKSLESLLGVEYLSDCGCWSASVVGQRYIKNVEAKTGKDIYKNAIFFQLQLKDLGKAGKSPLETLRLAIPGYSNVNEAR
ncbi:MAG: LPS-assembly protein LptD [Neisseriaceae bacterium]|nr:LPS-assembly protein LptD [Neisseriaceae bacterium]